MHTITCYPIGNADTTLIELEGGKLLLFDFAARRDPNDSSDRRVDLAAAIHNVLRDAGRDGIDILAITHLDEDHVDGAADFFELRHASTYQGDGRVPFAELWVPAAAIFESRDDLCDDARAIQSEARYRLEHGQGIRVFSRPAVLDEWLHAHGLTVDARRNLITDAGQLVPGFDKATDGVEFFVHSPFAKRDEMILVDRNGEGLMMQATFVVDDVETRLIISGDAPHDVLADIVEVTHRHGNEDRLRWDIFHLPHHCSYLSLGPDKGAAQTEPVPEVAWLFEEQGNYRRIVISPSDPIPTEDTDQPPHRQAANYHKETLAPDDGEFMVTMEHPSVAAPEAIVLEIDSHGAKARKRILSSAAVISSRPAPRAG